METLRKLRALQFRFSRWLLFTWIRPTCLGCDADSLELNTSDLICYVLPSRSVADLLVTDMACERSELPIPTSGIEAIDESRAFFFLGHPEGTFGRKTLRQQSERMARLFEHQEALGDSRKIKIVPVSIFWGHQPDREKSIFKLLLSENWSATSQVKKFFAGLFHRKHILVQFGKPIHLDELMASEEDRARQIRKLLRLVRVHFNRERQAIIGPDLSHRRTLLNTILSAPEVRAAIEREARGDEGGIARAEKKALGYAREIASDQSYRVIRFFDVLLTWLWNNLYDGIEVNNINTLKTLAQSHEIIYTPCHRSHIDYLLLSYVLYHNGLTPPHIAAGRNLNLPVVGPLLRRAGAFFMRRTFQGDQLYKEVFDEYLHQMFTKGYSVEYFIEGGRSRTGRTLQPRTGMLSMTVSSFQKDAEKPIAFMPVYFGYERVLESSTYMSELSGKDKQTESVFDLFGIFSSFKHEFGQVTVNFGEPVLLQEFLDEQLPGWRVPDDCSANDFSLACLTLARRLATHMNTAVAVKPSNLVALALLSTERQNIEERHLAGQINLLRAVARGCAAEGCSITALPAETIVAQAIAIFGLTRESHPFGAIVSASPQQAVTLTYNANSVLHAFALPSLVARFIRVSGRATDRELAGFVTTLFPALKAEMFLAWTIDELPAVLADITNCLADLNIVTREGNSLCAPPPESREYSSLHHLANITDPTLERFYIVIALLQRETGLSAKELESAAQGIAAQLSTLYGINSPDFFEKSLFSTFLGTLRSEALIDSDLRGCDAFSRFEETAARTINPDVRYNVLQAVDNHASQAR